MFVADQYRVRRIAPNGTITIVAGNGREEVSGDGGRALDAGLGELVASRETAARRLKPA